MQRHPALRTWIHLDERSCAYFALGLAQGGDAPVALLCTSGSAALNFAPAVAEAATAGLPLVVLTADRPPELRGWAPIRPSINRGCTAPRQGLRRGAPARPRRCGRRRGPALGPTRPRPRDGRAAGPVHLNLPFREPLIPDLPPPAVLAPDRTGPPPRVEPAAGDIAALASLVGERRRGLIVAGPQHAPDSVQAITGLAAALGYPILADPLSQLRRGPHDRSHVIAGYDAMLRAPAGPDLRPEVVLRVGRTPTSKALGAFLAGLVDVEQVVIAEPGRWNDPDLRATRSLDADPTAVCRRLLGALATPPAADAAWLAAWREGERRASQAVDAGIRDGGLGDGLTEPGAIRDLIDALPPGAAIVAGNSMPIRDLDTVLRPGPAPLHVYGNRGASGIDGVVSTALGIAAARPETPLALVLGDLSAYHDMNGLLAAGRFGLAATIVVLNNDGGGIFSMLPQARRVPEFEPLFGTPHGLRFEHAAAQYGLDYARPGTPQAYREALADSLGRDGAQLIEVTTERAANAALHEAIWRRVRDALA